MNTTTTSNDTDFAIADQFAALDLQSLTEAELAFVGGGTDITNMY